MMPEPTPWRAIAVMLMWLTSIAVGTIIVLIVSP
jgi:hypothetical protein